MDLAVIREMFTPGQKVEVRQGGVFQYAGTVVGYTRCESFRVRDPMYGDVCDHHYTELTPVPGECPGCVGRGTGETCWMCDLPVPARLRRTKDSPPEYSDACGDCRTGRVHVHSGAVA